MFLAVLLATGLGFAQPHPKWQVEFQSGRYPVLGLPLPECDKPVYEIAFTGTCDEKGVGKGTLTLDPTAPAYDELGMPAPATALPKVTLKVAVKHEKTLVVKVFPRQRPGGPDVAPVEVEWRLYAITGEKVTSKLFLAMPTGGEWQSGRLLVHDDKGKVKHVVEFAAPPRPEPCHPGCFPAGTTVQLRDRTTTVDKVAAGDKVATIGRDGKLTEAVVESVFVTTNKLIEVKTTAGTLVTTETQPLSLTNGELKAAGELKAGDEVWRWDGGSRKSAKVESVTATGRRERVYNLILKDEGVFVAGGFLARSKPQATPIPPP